MGVQSYSAIVDKLGVTISMKDNTSPYVPYYVGINKIGVVVSVWDDELERYMCKKFEWRDLLIMHKALTRIFGKKPKKKRKA